MNIKLFVLLLSKEVLEFDSDPLQIAVVAKVQHRPRCQQRRQRLGRFLRQCFGELPSLVIQIPGG